MQVNNVQELDDRTITFTGTLTAVEAGAVVSIGLNTLWANGMLHMVGGIDVVDVPNNSDGETLN